MKRLVYLILISILAVSIVGCGQRDVEESKIEKPEIIKAEDISSDELYINKDYNEKNMKNIYGESLEIKDENIIFGSKKAGYIILNDNIIDKIENKDSLDCLGLGSFNFCMSYIPSKYMDKMNALTEEAKKLKEENKDPEILSEEEIMEFYTEMFSNSYNYISFFAVKKENENERQDYLQTKEQYKEDELIFESETMEYHLLYNKEVNENENWKTSDVEDIKFLSENIKLLRENLILFSPIEAPKFSSLSSFKDFETTDVDGNKINQDIFKDYDLTLVNIWATYCGPCIMELPDLQKVFENSAKNINLISICTDGKEDLELTKEILEKKEVTFKTLVASESLNENVLNNISATPTTVLVDSEGNIIGEPIVGAFSSDSEENISEYNKLIESYIK